MDNNKFDKEYHKRWKANNKDKVSEHNARQYENKQEYLAEEIPCKMCNKYLKRSSMGKHKKCCQGFIDTSDWTQEARLSLREEYYNETYGVNDGTTQK